MRVISYNLRKHRAAGELVDLVEGHSADVLCLQECDTTDMPEEIGGLRLADSTQRNRLGLAVYYRANTFRPVEVRALALKKSLHDYVLKPAEERLLGVRLHDIDHGRDIVVASFHAAPLTALNSLRRHQIRTALAELENLGEGLPALMVGDYNYPVFKEYLGQKVRAQGYELTLSDARTYTRYRFFRGHYDFATSYLFDIEHIRTLPQGSSDHLPILVTAEVSAGRAAAVA
ncbi:MULTISPECIES: endonuclease/exonuclease/phosphatase family protein [Microbacterium]|uniref:Endonuclease/exonuclease/phosphatase family protein n=1 Tax=Microbacterium wangchenii TaxID=2541726 RepID=A0ABX5SR24_9MICO|nr:MULTISPECIES: endonuclease/exonuclease/phosphatase family protein [Microbacterium]MCK6068153.1 endonuclease/exonuclease/phosphatase family protein [Microbacterium sp. EYE_512]QBR87732.1 endonuclease/exonuclease/phosphatase family protein [Microbacterium wangchenii]TFV84187.1 endonuclease/exonuclease/phosphatase family protein [Microbacterium sp. dk485]TXK16000.1 endonuclease/exonuclease/phosphatase family protein [Microbacterium wangchenii]